MNSDGVLVRLLERGLVEECGRSETPGRPILYGTSVRFLQAMGIESLSELPVIERIKTQKDNVVHDAENDDESADGEKIDAADEADVDITAETFE